MAIEVLSRKEAYQKYLKTPEAQISKYLDSLEERRIRREHKLSRNVARTSWRKLMQCALLGMLLLIVACGAERPRAVMPLESECRQYIEKKNCIREVRRTPDGKIYERKECIEEFLYAPQSVM